MTVASGFSRKEHGAEAIDFVRDSWIRAPLARRGATPRA